jgi:hypothetical protein
MWRPHGRNDMTIRVIGFEGLVEAYAMENLRVQAN